MARAPILALTILTLAATTAVAQPAGEPVGRRARLEAVDRLPVSTGAGATLAGGLTPMQREIKAVLDEARVRRERLLRQAAATGERPAGLDRLQTGTRRQVLEIQERWARRDGRLELARSIRRAIDALPAAPILEG